MLKVATLLLLVLSLSAAADGKASKVSIFLDGDDVQSNGRTTLALKTATADNVLVELVTHEVQIGQPSDPEPKEINSNCTYSRYPCSILDSLRISVKGKEIDVPRSVFCDLADLSKGVVRRVGPKYVLTLEGGDAAGSFIVEVQFDRTGVTKRTISPGEAADEPSEVTIYHRVVFN